MHTLIILYTSVRCYASLHAKNFSKGSCQGNHYSLLRKWYANNVAIRISDIPIRR